MPKLLVSFLGILFTTISIQAQSPKKYTSSQIFEELQKLNFLGTALYIAAHPDDENTRLISYLSNHVKARTAYLSITRGDGGQNLIGTELKELLGVLRTQELMAARRVDGGEQFFTRANDFGYSKHPSETMEIWNKKDVLSDVVWVIRNLKPDVIINRFDHRSSGTTHGHHTASAMLSKEAFSLSGNKSAYPEQLSITDVWQPKRLFFNTSWWFYGSEENFKKADKSKMVMVDVGTYFPLKGLSNTEIAAMASSQHLCQGFGRLSTRGSQDEYLEFLEGDMPEENDIFSGINTTWSRIKGGKTIGDILYNVEKNFNFKNPKEHLDSLLKAYTLLQTVEDNYWKTVKSKQLEKIIIAVLGLYIEASTTEASTTPGDTIEVKIEAINRSAAAVMLKGITTYPDKIHHTYSKFLQNNLTHQEKIKVIIPLLQAYSAPYWLTETGSIGMYTVKNTELIGKPETPHPVSAIFHLEINDVTISIEQPVVYRYSKPEKGEMYQPFEVSPPVTSSIDHKVIVFNGSASKEIPVKITAQKDNVTGTASLKIPKGWKVTPESVDFLIKEKGNTKTVVFMLYPPLQETEGTIQSLISFNNKQFTKELVDIDYEHITKQQVLLPATAKIVHTNVKRAGENIAYIMGAGDEIPKSLQQIGYNVHSILPEEIRIEELLKFDAVVLGIRAYNVIGESLTHKQSYLLEYVKKGGVLIVQYNTQNRREELDVKAPYPLKISGDRVTEENAKVTILNKNHPLINFPNTITEFDFDNWVQERGLYFPSNWSGEFLPVLSMHDTGESPKQGSLLVAQYGKGYYIYTGLSFFRQLPEGVAGAYKLFANMLSISKAPRKK